jgi:hypothetical protein
VDSMHENHLYSMKTTHAALEFGRSQRAFCDNTRKAAAASAPEGPLRAPEGPLAAAVAPEAPRAPPAPEVPTAVLVARAAPEVPTAVLVARAARAAPRAWCVQYVPELAEIDADVLRGLDASVLLSPRRWEWASDIEACFARA